MKKIVVTIAVMLMIACQTCMVFGAETTVDQVPHNEEIGIYGNCFDTKNYYEIILGVDGMNSTELPGGIVLSGLSDSDGDDGLRVVIIPVTAEEESEAYSWLSDSVKDTADTEKEPWAYWLAFYRGDSPASSDGTVDIAMTVKEGYEKSSLYYMNGDADITKKGYSYLETGVTFSMDKSGYYIFMNQSSILPPDKPTDPSEPVKPSDPGNADPADGSAPAATDQNQGAGNGTGAKTGDYTELTLWAVLLLLAGIGALMIVGRGKRNETAGEKERND